MFPNVLLLCSHSFDSYALCSFPWQLSLVVLLTACLLFTSDVIQTVDSYSFSRQHSQSKNHPPRPSYYWRKSQSQPCLRCKRHIPGRLPWGSKQSCQIYHDRICQIFVEEVQELEELATAIAIGFRDNIAICSKDPGFIFFSGFGLICSSPCLVNQVTEPSNKSHR